MGKYLCIRAIRAIRVIRVVPCDLRRECLCVRNLSVSSHIQAPLNLFSGLQIRIEGGGDFRCSEALEIGILEVARGFALRGGSVAKSPKVSRSRASMNSRGCVEDLDIRCIVMCRARLGLKAWAWAGL